MSEFSNLGDLPVPEQPHDIPDPVALPHVAIGNEAPADDDAVHDSNPYGEAPTGVIGVGDVGAWGEPEPVEVPPAEPAVDTTVLAPEEAPAPSASEPEESATEAAVVTAPPPPDPLAAEREAIAQQVGAAMPEIENTAGDYMPGDAPTTTDIKDTPATPAELPALAEASHGHTDEYFDQFTVEHMTEILDKIDGPDGFFARAEQAGVVEQLNPHVAEAIDRADDAGLERLGITKQELKVVAAAFGPGQARSNISEVKVPSEMYVEGTRVHTNLGDFNADRDPEDGTVTVPRGQFTKSAGELWIVGPKLEERYPDPGQRRIAALWTYGHEFAHGVAGGDLMDGLIGLTGQPVTMPDDRPSTTTDQVRQLFDATPATPLTAYSGSYRGEDGQLPSREEGPIGFIKGFEEELCETAAATLFDFAPTPGREPAEALNNPHAGREEFQQGVWDYLQAAPRTTPKGYL
jgi:hypothetical protein